MAAKKVVANPKTAVNEKAKPDSKDYLAIMAALLETILLPCVLTIVVLVVLYFVLWVLAY